MSNTIKLKRGSGSDPGSSDLSVGEVALRTDNGKLFTKKDDGSVAQIGGGAGAIDDGAITNAKVASDAAIAGSKIDPDFGSQHITTTGNINGGTNLTLASTVPNIRLNDSDNNPDYRIVNRNGVFNIEDVTHTNAIRFSINTDGHTDINNHLDVGSGLDVTGDITATGTVTSTGLIMGDNKSILLGASDDFRIRHTGSHSEITDEGTGNLRLGSNQVIIGSPTFDETSAKFVDDGAVELYFDNSLKFYTTDDGIESKGELHFKAPASSTGEQVGRLEWWNENDAGVMAKIAVDRTASSNAPADLVFSTSANVDTTANGGDGDITERLRITSAGDIQIPVDGDKLQFGAGQDLSLFHDGSDSFITNTTGTLKIQTQVNIDKGDGSEHIARFIPDGAVVLYFNGNERFETTSAGATLTGTLTATTFSGSGASLTSLNASNISSGTIPAARVGDITGNAASADTVDISSVSNDEAEQVVFSTNSSGSGRTLGVDSSSSAFTYNPSTNVLTAGTFSGALSGNASTATKLATARTIAGVSFDGSANISLNNNAITNGAGYTTFSGSYNDLSNKPTIPTNNNQLSNGAGYITSVSGQNYNSLSNLPTIPSNNNQLSNGAGYITSVSGQNYNSLSNLPTIPSNNNQLSNGAGYITSGSNRAAQAWVNFRGNSSVSINDDANVSSISDNGTGQYTVNFSSSMPNSSYCVSVGFMDDAGNSNVAKIVDNSLGTGSFQIRCGSFQDGSGNTDRDFDGVFCSIFAG